RFMDEWWALAAATLMAASLPFIHYSRGTFTEIPTLVLVAGGLWAADTAIRAQPRYAFGAGLLLGGAAMVRVDAWMVGVALSLFLLTTTWFEEDQETWVAGRVLVGFLTTGILGLFDLTIFAVPYFGLLRASIIPLLAAMVVVRILVPASQTPELVRLASLVQRNRRLVANTLTVVFVAAIGFLWFVRPALFPSRVFSPLGPYGLEPIQIREGLPVDPTRNYAEMTVWWLTWYLGAPLTALGFGGFIAALRRGIAKGQSAIRLPLLVFLVPTITYLVKPSVNADQIWAIRRFTPIVLPGLVLMGLGTAAYFYSRHQAGSRIRKLIVALTLAVSLPVVFTSAPLIAVADRPGVETQFANLCDNLGDAQSIVLVNDVPERPLSGLIGPPLRAWCGVSIAGASPELAGTLGADAVIASSPDLIPGGANFSHILQAEAWEASLTGAPDATEIRSIELYVGFAAR
ncbi:MAG: hypothetical protein HKN91_11150, partial [Acidimicrobiia bacterium]|nr:hypothetical protein [Acidimicrobiia bacterium]